MKMETASKCGCYSVGRDNMHGNYCPATGEYYLGIYNYDAQEELAIASCWYDRHDYYHVYSARGYSYEVVRELLRLGHLTPKTLASFIEAGGIVWWVQP